LFLCTTLIAGAQEKLLKGKILNTKNIEGIHVLNRLSRFNTITNFEGAFQIRAKANDTLLVSSIAYVPELVIVTQEIFDAGIISIRLKELVNEK